MKLVSVELLAFWFDILKSIMGFTIASELLTSSDQSMLVLISFGKPGNDGTNED